MENNPGRAAGDFLKAKSIFMEYKFRGKRKDNGEWVYGSLVDKDYILNYIDLAQSWIPLTSDHKVTCRAYEVIPESVGMWTGLKDKNGKEIYAGDVLHGFQKEQKYKNQWNVTDTVNFYRGGFIVFSKRLQDAFVKDDYTLNFFSWCVSGNMANEDTYYDIIDIEVVGNIYEQNPAKGAVSNTMQDPNLKPDELKAAEQAAAEVETEETTDNAEEGGLEG